MPNKIFILKGSEKIPFDKASMEDKSKYDRMIVDKKGNVQKLTQQDIRNNIKTLFKTPKTAIKEFKSSQVENIKSVDNTKPKIFQGRIIYNIKIIELSKKRLNDVGVLKYEGFIIYISNARKDEIVDIEITKIHSSKTVAFAKVINYRKTEGELDYDRQFHCPKEVNSISRGGGNRNKCISVLYPEERGTRKF